MYRRSALCPGDLSRYGGQGVPPVAIRLQVFVLPSYLSLPQLEELPGCALGSHVWPSGRALCQYLAEGAYSQFFRSTNPPTICFVSWLFFFYFFFFFLAKVYRVLSGLLSHDAFCQTAALYLLVNLCWSWAPAQVS